MFCHFDNQQPNSNHTQVCSALLSEEGQVQILQWNRQLP